MCLELEQELKNNVKTLTSMDVHENIVVVDLFIMFVIGIALFASFSALLYTYWDSAFMKQFWTKRRRRRAHLRYVDKTILELKYKIINLTLACNRGDLSLTAFNRRVLNAAVLIRRYEIKRTHLNRLVR